jgi:periplasmic divalent cation tolerance protein
MHAMLYVTTKDVDDAARLARHLLEQKLVACANIFPVRSLYWWQGHLKDESEAVAIMKTRRDLVGRAMAAAKDVHGYDVPCIVSYAMDAALDEYGAWIDRETEGQR